MNTPTNPVALEPTNEEALDPIEALRRCAKQFAFYAEQHLAKGTDEAAAKAGVNCQMQEMCESAIAAWNRRVPPSPAGGEGEATPAYDLSDPKRDGGPRGEIGAGEFEEAVTLEQLKADRLAQHGRPPHHPPISASDLDGYWLFVSGAKSAPLRSPSPDLAALAELSAAATGNIWLASSLGNIEQHHTGRVIAKCDVGPRHGQFRIEGTEAKANAAFIVAACNYVRSLVGARGGGKP